MVAFVCLAAHDTDQQDILHRTAQDRLLEDMPVRSAMAAAARCGAVLCARAWARVMAGCLGAGSCVVVCVVV